ncbi:MAG: hypothetical protein AB9869_13155 [Verrucomicrobiia bacterium]
MTDDKSNSAKEALRAKAIAKSPVVTRRGALTMAFRKAVAAIGGAKEDATKTIAQLGAQLAGKPKIPPPKE